jgi:hypothetical protein
MSLTSVRGKTLKLNSTPTIYGSFAEIGAGQETSRWFFRTPGASNTVAKAMSAYDMAFSDTIYGREATGRYVCEARLMKMLDHEFGLLQERLAQRGPTQFFAFANTVAARSRKTRGRGHGWLGVRWQKAPGEEPCEIRLHIHLLDAHNTLQQEALGIVGVNLIYAAFFAKSPAELIGSLTEDLEELRVQVDFIAWDDPTGKGPEPRELQFHLLKCGLTPAVSMDGRGHPQQLGEMLHAKTPLIFQSDYKPVSNYQLDLIECAKKQVSKEDPKVQPVALISEPDPDFSFKDYRERIDLLGLVELPCMVTQNVSITELLHIFDLNNLSAPHVLLTTHELRRILADPELENTTGGLLGMLGELFHAGLKLYLCPTLEGDKLVNIDNFEGPENSQTLLEYLKDVGFLRGTQCIHQDNLKISGEQIRKDIKSGAQSWREKVPKAVAQYITENKVF